MPPRGLLPLISGSELGVWNVSAPTEAGRRCRTDDSPPRSEETYSLCRAVSALSFLPCGSAPLLASTRNPLRQALPSPPCQRRGNRLRGRAGGSSRPQRRLAVPRPGWSGPRVLVPTTRQNHLGTENPGVPRGPTDPIRSGLGFGIMLTLPGLLAPPLSGYVT